MRSRRWGLLVALMLTAGCAQGGDAPVDPPAGQPAADLTIVLDETGNGSTRTFTLTCDPVGGDHPEAEAACRALAGAGVGAFAPVPRDVACTEQWGGPQMATVRGDVDGQRVDARFDRTNGCEISRWDTLAPLLGGSGGA